MSEVLIVIIYVFIVIAVCAGLWAAGSGVNSWFHRNDYHCFKCQAGLHDQCTGTMLCECRDAAHGEAGGTQWR